MAETTTRIVNLPAATQLNAAMDFVTDSTDGSGSRKVSYDMLRQGIQQAGAENLAAAYDATKTYAIGDYCTYGGTLYVCSTAITEPEAWTAGHWNKVELAQTVSDVKADLTLINDAILHANGMSKTAQTVTFKYKTETGRTYLLKVYGEEGQLIPYASIDGTNNDYTIRGAALSPGQQFIYNAGATYDYIRFYANKGGMTLEITDVTAQVGENGTLYDFISNRITGDINGTADKIEKRNLIGRQRGALYPVYLLSSDTITISTYDGLPAESAINVVLYNKDLATIYPVSLLANTSERVVKLASLTEPVYFIGFNQDLPQTHFIQVEKGDYKTAYQEYDDTNDSPNLIGENPNIYYPVRLDEDDCLAIKVFDIAEVTSYRVLELYDKNFVKLTSYSTTSVPRVIRYNKNTEVAYMKFNYAPQTHVMVQKGTIFADEFSEAVTKDDYISNLLYGADTNTENQIGKVAGALYPVDIKSDTCITIAPKDSTLMPNNQYVVVFWDKDGRYITSISIFSQPRTIKTTSDIRYVSFDKELPTDIQIEVGGVPTEYKEYGLQEVSINNDDSYNDVLSFVNCELHIYNPYKNAGANKYKGQMHCHTQNSDGLMTVDQLVTDYADAGYDFMTITDHNFITEEPANMHGMIWLGNSQEDTHQAWGYQHCNIYNCEEVIERQSEYMNRNSLVSCIHDYAIDQNAIICLNHPNDATLGGMPKDRILLLPKGYTFVEIFNAADAWYAGEVSTYESLPATVQRYDAVYHVVDTDKYYIAGSASATDITAIAWREYDKTTAEYALAHDLWGTNYTRTFCNMLDHGLKVFGLSVDDCHNIGTFNIGWIVAFASGKTRAEIWKSLTDGAFYASTGVALSSVTFNQNGILNVVVDTEEADNNVQVKYIGEGQNILYTTYGKSTTYQLTVDDKYVFAEIKIGNKYAWTQPIYVVRKKYNFEF